MEISAKTFDAAPIINSLPCQTAVRITALIATWLLFIENTLHPLNLSDYIYTSSLREYINNFDIDSDTPETFV